MLGVVAAAGRLITCSRIAGVYAVASASLSRLVLGLLAACLVRCSAPSLTWRRPIAAVVTALVPSGELGPVPHLVQSASWRAQAHGPASIAAWCAHATPRRRSLSGQGVAMLKTSSSSDLPWSLKSVTTKAKFTGCLQSRRVFGALFMHAHSDVVSWVSVRLLRMMGT